MRPNELPLSAVDLSELLERVVSKEADFRFQAKGASMAPFIKDSDIITISPFSRSPAGLGSIAAFTQISSKRLVIHRIVGRSGSSYIMKGDRCQAIDGLIPAENVLGIATKVEREGRKIFFGLGPERFIVAFLSKNNLLPFVFWLWRLIPHSARRFIK